MAHHLHPAKGNEKQKQQNTSKYLQNGHYLLLFQITFKKNDATSVSLCSALDAIAKIICIIM